MSTGQGRQPAGTPSGGRFTTGARAETGIELTAPAQAASPFVFDRGGDRYEVQMRPGQQPQTAGLPGHRPDDWDPFTTATDRAVASVHDGLLSQKVASGYQMGNLSTWHNWAQNQAAVHGLEDPETAAAYAQFAAGIEHGTLALMSGTAEVRDLYVLHRLGWETGSSVRLGDWAQARRLTGFKRTSRASREEWASGLVSAPSEAARRGYLAAGLILSGLDDWWGLRADPAATVTGA